MTISPSREYLWESPRQSSLLFTLAIFINHVFIQSKSLANICTVEIIMERECSRFVSTCLSIILTPFPPVLLWVLSFYTMWTAIGACTWFFSVPPEEVCILMYHCHVEGRLASSYCNFFPEGCIKGAHVLLLMRASRCVAGCYLHNPVQPRPEAIIIANLHKIAPPHSL